MSHLEPLDRKDLPELEELFSHYDETLSFVPNSLFTMARRPETLRVLSDLITVIWRTGTIRPVAGRPVAHNFLHDPAKNSKECHPRHGGGPAYG